MTVYELYTALSARIPSELSCEWDNDGLMCCTDRDRQVGRILVTLDVTEEAVAYAAAHGYDLILSHHPLIFRGLKSVCDGMPVAQKTITLIQKDIAVLSFHTRLDAAEGGVNDTLASLLGLAEVMSFGEKSLGRIGTLPEAMSAEAFAEKVKSALGAPFVLLGDASVPCRRVAVLGGEGGDDIAAARGAGADTYVSGRLGYHPMTDAAEGGMNLIEAGHFYTEHPVCGALCRMLSEIAPELSCHIFFSNTIRAV